MSWTEKTKVDQETDRGEIQTPDTSRILVGSSEDEVLIYQEVSTAWEEKLQQDPGTWAGKTKTVS